MGRAGNCAPHPISIRFASLPYGGGGGLVGSLGAGLGPGPGSAPGPGRGAGTGAGAGAGVGGGFGLGPGGGGPQPERIPETITIAASAANRCTPIRDPRVGRVSDLDFITAPFYASRSSYIKAAEVGLVLALEPAQGAVRVRA
jgi:hypothetical protein